MKVQVMRIEEDKNFGGYALIVEDYIWLPDDGDYLASITVPYDKIVEILEPHYGQEGIEEILEEIEDFGHSNVEDTYIETGGNEERGMSYVNAMKQEFYARV